MSFFQRRGNTQSHTTSEPQDTNARPLSRGDFIAAAAASLGALAVNHAFRNRAELKHEIEGGTSQDSTPKNHRDQSAPKKATTQHHTRPSTPSDAAIDLIKSFEAYRSRAYLCPAGQPTIGYGHTKGVELGDTLQNESQADSLLRRDLQGHTKSVLRVFYDIPLTQAQLDALASADFNASCLKNGATGFAQYARAILPELNTTHDPNRRLDLQKKLVSYLCRYNRVDGELFDGLLRRRLSEGLLLAGTKDPIISTDEYKTLKQQAHQRLETDTPPPQRFIREMVSRSFASRGLLRR